MPDNLNVDRSPRKPVHSGIVRVGDYKLKVHVLDNGRTVIEEDSIIDFMNWMGNERPREEEVLYAFNKIFHMVDDWEPCPPDNNK